MMKTYLRTSNSLNSTNIKFYLILLLVAFTITAQVQNAVAILTFKAGDGISDGEAEVITDRLRVEIFRTNNVEVMERDQMKDILKEQGFQQSGACTDDACIVEIGQLLGVTELITGSIGKLGSMFLINARSIDISTGKISKVVSIDVKGDIEDVVGKLKEIAVKITSSDENIEQMNYSNNKNTTEYRYYSDNLPETVIAKADTVNCFNTVLIEAPTFKGNLDFKLTKDDMEDIHDDLIDAVEDFFDDQTVSVILNRQLKKLPSGCNSPIMRIKLNSYSVEPDDDQFAGTAEATFYFYTTTKDNEPSFEITIKGTGSRHWGKRQPFINAMSELADELSDQMDDSKYLKKLRKTME